MGNCAPDPEPESTWMTAPTAVRDLALKRPNSASGLSPHDSETHGRFADYSAKWA
jgi:hypothetical protein